MAEIYLLRRNGLWFRPKAAGYASQIYDAGHYTEAEAAGYLKAEGVTMHAASEMTAELRLSRAGLRRSINRIDAMLAALSQ